jgi:hypothetical protein
MAFGKRRTVSENGGEKTFNNMVIVESVSVDEHGNHVVQGKTMIGGKPITVYGQPKKGTDDKGQTYVHGLGSPVSDELTTKDENGKIDKKTIEQQLGAGGILQVMRGEFRGKDPLKVEIGEKSHFKIHFYDEADIQAKGNAFEVIYSTHNTVNTYSGNQLLPAEVVVDAAVEKAMLNLQDVRNRAPAVTLIGTDANGQVVTDAQLVLVNTWNKEEQRVMTEAEIRANFEKELTRFKAEMSKDAPEVVGFEHVMGESMRFNKTVNEISRNEFSTTRDFVVGEQDGNKEVVSFRFARPGIVKEKYSVVKDKATLQVNEYNSVNTIAYTGGGRSPYKDKDQIVIPETFVERLAAQNGLTLADSFKETIKAEITSAFNDEKAYRDAKKASEANKTQAATAALDAEMDDDNDQSQSPGM